MKPSAQSVPQSPREQRIIPAGRARRGAERCVGAPPWGCSATGVPSQQPPPMYCQCHLQRAWSKHAAQDPRHSEQSWRREAVPYPQPAGSSQIHVGMKEMAHHLLPVQPLLRAWGHCQEAMPAAHTSIGMSSSACNSDFLRLQERKKCQTHRLVANIPSSIESTDT